MSVQQAEDEYRDAMGGKYDLPDALGEMDDELEAVGLMASSVVHAAEALSINANYNLDKLSLSSTGAPVSAKEIAEAIAEAISNTMKSEILAVLHAHIEEMM